MIEVKGSVELAPRLIGPEAAVKLMVTNPMRQNKMLSAEQAARGRPLLP